MAGSVAIRRKCAGDVVVGRFCAADWHKIFTDIDTDSQLNAFIARDSELVRAYMLENVLTGESFGWICLRRADTILCDSVEFHGGAWSASPAASLGKFTAACALIHSVLRCGVQVNSRAFATNGPALKFLQAIGFRPVHRQSSRPIVYLRLSRRRFYASAIWRRVGGTFSL